MTTIERRVIWEYRIRPGKASVSPVFEVKVRGADGWLPWRGTKEPGLFDIVYVVDGDKDAQFATDIEAQP